MDSYPLVLPDVARARAEGMARSLRREPRTVPEILREASLAMDLEDLAQAARRCPVVHAPPPRRPGLWRRLLGRRR